MGIQGLPAFIRSRAKECIRDLKLSDLHHKSVAIDGNIVTQRFHHSTESEHPNRTILGWYRFIKNLKSYSITPIVVFDGSRRVSAKARELERRMNARQLLAGRAGTEEARATRLRELKEITSTLQSLSSEDRSRTLAETQKLLEIASEDTVGKPLSDLSSTSLSARFANLTLSMQATKLSDAPTLSKRQQLIAQGEAKAFMNALSTGTPLPEEGEEDPIQALQSVLTQSSTMAEDYGRKAKPVSKETYTDCMDIIRSLGVPVLLTSSTEPQEAESLCASLVEAGYADVVITEDTDVLVFDSPMLRHIGPVSREGELLHGREIRQALGFETREQWVDFCLLCGCDFIERIKGLGPVTAYKMLRQHGSIEAILKSGDLEKQRRVIHPPADVTSYLTDIEAARAIYLTPMPVDFLSKDKVALQEEDPNISAILKGFDLDIDRIGMRSGFEDNTLEGNENRYLGLDFDEAFGLASLDKPTPGDKP